MAKRKHAPEPQQQVHVTLFEEWLEEVWVWFKGNWQWPALGVVIGLVLVSGYYWRVHATEQRLNEGWTAFNTELRKAEPDQRVAGLRNLIAQHSDPALLAFAYQLIGDMEYQRAFELSGEPQKEALKQAREAYLTVLEKFSDQALPVGNVRIGLGLVYENQHQWDQALQEYKQVLNDKRLVGVPVQSLAAERMKQLVEYKIPLVLGPAESQPASLPAAGR